ncbi:SDR family oxidoreductase [Paraburkholderia sp. RCC_158]|uniref:SDR family oxidoreductase n=1 Tax=Paraburkholderia sp. RCC_158 TaxID=3239220 RepID=UPI0035233A61
MSRTVLITGCSSGFGEATAHLFAQRGWNVVATMRRPEVGVELGKRSNVLVTRLDVQDYESISAAIAAGISRFGSIDVVVNNAGFGLNAVFESIPREKIQEQFDVNLFGVMDVVRAILPHFRAKRDGVIVNVSSGVGVFGLPMATLYNASKFALEGFSEALSYELAAVGVTTKIVEPGAAPSTGFPARTGEEAKQFDIPSDYDDFIAATGAIYSGFRDGADENVVQKVAEGIFFAATDHSHQLRYVLTEDIKPFVTARRETSESEYMGLMRRTFSLTASEA